MLFSCSRTKEAILLLARLQATLQLLHQSVSLRTRDQLAFPHIFFAIKFLIQNYGIV